MLSDMVKQTYRHLSGDELDDDGDEPMDEEPFEDEIEEEVVEDDVPTMEDTPEPVGEDILDEEISDEDLGSFDDSETEDWEKELEKELEEELQAEGDPGGFYEEESFEDFESDEIGMESDDTEVATSVFGSDDDSDDFDTGIEYAEPASAGGATPPPSGGGSTYQEPPSGNKGKFVRTVVIGTLAIAVVAFVFLLIYNSGSDEPKEKKVAKKETPVKKAPAQKAEEPKKEEPKKEEPKKEEPKPVAKKPEPKPEPVQKPAGEITSLTEKTGRTYVIIGSFFDEDLAMDYAKELSADSKSPIIIHPFAEHRFYRVAIAEFNSFADAKVGIESFKSEYGADIWPLRY